jgi:homoserine dehydrogenase
MMLMELKVALAGGGNVTRAFLKYWGERQAEIELRIVSVLRQHGVWHGNEGVTLDLDALPYRPDLDPYNGAQLLIESLPSVYPHGEPATSILMSALDRGIYVLTVDKGPLVAAYPQLAGTAARTGARLWFCVGGALPAVDVAVRDLRGTTIRTIRAILNGTTGFILSEMQGRDCSFEEALAAAQERGIAEPDPSQDIDGIDTAAKLLILVNAGLGQRIRLEDCDIRGIRNLNIGDARRAGKVWRLIGTYADAHIRVAPEMVCRDDVFALVRGTDKIVEFDSVEMGRLAVMGGASGRTQMGAAMTKEVLNMYLPA